jgi:hypothetical protein
MVGSGPPIRANQGAHTLSLVGRRSGARNEANWEFDAALLFAVSRARARRAKPAKCA